MNGKFGIDGVQLLVGVSLVLIGLAFLIRVVIQS